MSRKLKNYRVSLVPDTMIYVYVKATSALNALEKAEERCENFDCSDVTLTPDRVDLIQSS